MPANLNAKRQTRPQQEKPTTGKATTVTILDNPATNFASLRPSSTVNDKNDGAHQSAPNGDTTFLLHQLRNLTAECENRDQIIVDLQKKQNEFQQKEELWQRKQDEFQKQQLELLRQQELQFERLRAQLEERHREQIERENEKVADEAAQIPSMFVHPPSSFSEADKTAGVASTRKLAESPLAQSSVIKNRVTIETAANSDNESVDEDVSFAYEGPIFDRSQTEIYKPFQKVVPPRAIEESKIVHPSPRRPVSVQNHQSRNVISDAAAHRGDDEVRLLDSLNSSLRHSLELEQNLEIARSEIAELKELVGELVKNKRISPRINAEPSVPVPLSAKEINSVPHVHSVPSKNHWNKPSNLSKLSSKLSASFQNAPPNEIIEELEKLLYEAETEITKLKGKAAVMGPASMPGITNSEIFNGLLSNFFLRCTFFLAVQEREVVLSVTYE